MEAITIIGRLRQQGLELVATASLAEQCEELRRSNAALVEQRGQLTGALEAQKRETEQLWADLSNRYKYLRLPCGKATDTRSHVRSRIADTFEEVLRTMGSVNMDDLHPANYDRMRELMIEAIEIAVPDQEV